MLFNKRAILWNSNLLRGVIKRYFASFFVQLTQHLVIEEGLNGEYRIFNLYNKSE